MILNQSYVNPASVSGTCDDTVELDPSFCNRSDQDALTHTDDGCEHNSTAFRFTSPLMAVIVSAVIDGPGKKEKL